MIATAESFAPAVETPKPARSRAPRKAGDREPGTPATRVPKRKDASLSKASFYLPNSLLKKLVVAGVIRGEDQSDIVAAVLAKELSSVTYYDRSARPTGETLMVTESAEAGQLA